MQVVLIMFRSDGERRSFSLTRETTVLGRREDCDLRIPLGEVSRKHCRLVQEGPTLRLEDLGSSNGTYLNGRRIQEAIVNPGDAIQVGPVLFAVQIDGVPPDEDLVAPQSGAATTAAPEESSAQATMESGEVGEELAADSSQPGQGEIPLEGEDQDVSRRDRPKQPR